MTSLKLPKHLVLSACEPFVEIFTIVDYNTGSEIRFAILGNIEFVDSVYIFGLEYDTYLSQLDSDCNDITIQVVEIIDNDSSDGILYSSAIELSSEMEHNLFELIKYQLESVITTEKYCTRCYE